MLDVCSKALPLFSGLEDKPRPLTAGEDAGFVEALPLRLPLPALTSLRALAPKLIRRANGVAGVLAVLASPSSIALSSIPGEPELVLETLSWRPLKLPNGEVWVGEPDKPNVEMDIRRR